jgi:hypothetical protein
VRYRYTIAAAVLFAALLVWVLLQERGRVPESGEVFGLDVKQVTRLEIVPRDAKPVTFEKRADQWWITAPFQGWANKDEVERISRSLCELKPSKRPDVDLKADAKAYGLENPFVTARVFVGSRKFEISLGNEAPVGGENYAAISGRKGLFIVPSFLKTDLMKKPEDMRDKKLAHYTKDDVVALDLQSTKGVFHIEGRPAQDPKDKDWFLTAPLQAKADRWAVADTLATKPSETEAKAFEEMPRDLSAVGLNAPPIKIILQLKDGKKVAVSLGSKVRRSVPRDTASTSGAATPAGMEEKDLVYAAVEGRPELLLVDTSFFSDLDKDLMQLRDKHVVLLERPKIRSLQVQRKTGLSFSLAKRADMWYMDTPQPAKAKQTKVEDLLWNLEDMETSEFLDKAPDLKHYGLAVPDVVITVGMADGKTLKLIFGYKTKEGRYYLKRDDSDTVFVVSDLLLNGLPKSADELKAGEEAGGPPMGPAEALPRGAPMSPGGPPPGSYPPPPPPPPPH